MAEPRVPGGRGEVLELPCGEEVPIDSFDLGMRAFDCDCGSTQVS